MKYYSEVTKEMYNSEKELVAAERAKAVEDAKKLEDKKSADIELSRLKDAYNKASNDYKKAGEEAEKILNEANKKADEILKAAEDKFKAAKGDYLSKLCKDNASFTYSGYTKEEAESILKKLLSDLWIF